MENQKKIERELEKMRQQASDDLNIIRAWSAYFKADSKRLRHSRKWFLKALEKEGNKPYIQSFELDLMIIENELQYRKTLE